MPWQLLLGMDTYLEIEDFFFLQKMIFILVKMRQTETKTYFKETIHSIHHHFYQVCWQLCEHPWKFSMLLSSGLQVRKSHSSFGISRVSMISVLWSKMQENGIFSSGSPPTAECVRTLMSARTWSATTGGTAQTLLTATSVNVSRGTPAAPVRLTSMTVWRTSAREGENYLLIFPRDPNTHITFLI